MIFLKSIGSSDSTAARDAFTFHNIIYCTRVLLILYYSIPQLVGNMITNRQYTSKRII